jgi:hypothetical protein
MKVVLVMRIVLVAELRCDVHCIEDQGGSGRGEKVDNKVLKVELGIVVELDSMKAIVEGELAEEKGSAGLDLQRALGEIIGLD